MRRLNLAICLVVGVSLLAGTPASAVAAADPSKVACIPVKRWKWVVKRKRVKRHGKVRVIKKRRKVRWTTCAPAPQLPPKPPPSPCPEPSSNLGVTADDADEQPRYILSRACVTAGQVTVELDNVGMDPHHVFMRPLGAASPEPVHRLPGEEPFEVPPLSQASDTFELTAGDWYLWCDLLLHEEQGMNATLAVR